MKKTNKVQLNHCPSCGRPAQFAYRTHGVEVRIHCQVCRLGTDWFAHTEDAALYWNEQPRIRQMDAEIAKLASENSALRSAMHELSGQMLKKMFLPDTQLIKQGPRSTQPDPDYNTLAYVRGPNNQPVPLKRCSKCDVMYPADEMVVVVGSPRRWICANCDQTK